MTTTTAIALGVLFVAVIVLVAVLGRLRRQTGGGLWPTRFSDGHMTTGPTGYPEEMKGHGKTISPTDNNAAKL